MVLWKDVKDISLPLRFQIPRGYCEYGISDFSQVLVKIADTEFLDWFKNIENILIQSKPIESRVKIDSISLKYVDGFTQVFDSSNVFTDEPVSFENSELDCMVDIDKVYNLNGKYGLTCKIFQVRVIPFELHFSS
jgi:hypothetical protein